MEMLERIVHLDLKGAPPRVDYLERVLLCMKAWGATGILLEWEDTFPYAWELADIGYQSGSGGDGVYLKTEVDHIFQFAKEIGLKAIQLVQTIGHMEFVLKHPKYIRMREAAESPAVLCPSRPEARALVCSMLEQVLLAQPDADYIHIGADEVWHLGECAVCWAQTGGDENQTAALYLDYIRYIAAFLKQIRPNITVLMWDDMLRHVNIDLLNQYDLGMLVQLVVWNYNTKENFQIEPSLWDNYAQVFPKVWAGSAFKGANGSCQILSPVNRYVGNHEAWIKEIKKSSSKISFTGIILTGWSRYDHFATLCELLPVSLPCLASCLKLLTKADDTPDEAVVCEALPSAEWPGELLAKGIHSFAMLRERAFAFINGDVVTTWMNPWQIENSYTNPEQIKGIEEEAKHLYSHLFALQAELALELRALTGRRSVEEWLRTFLAPLADKLHELMKVAGARVRAAPSVSPLNIHFLWRK